MGKAKNVLVAQSGGPSPVINNSLRGVVETCKSMPDDFGTVYGGWHGIEGVLKEELLDLSAQDPQEIALLQNTPNRVPRHLADVVAAFHHTPVAFIDRVHIHPVVQSRAHDRPYGGGAGMVMIARSMESCTSAILG